LAHLSRGTGWRLEPSWTRRRIAGGEPELLLWDAGLHGVIAIAVTPEVQSSRADASYQYTE
jgi:hypothetical protein